jgi:hypothetical protein
VFVPDHKARGVADQPDSRVRNHSLGPGARYLYGRPL